MQEKKNKKIKKREYEAPRVEKIKLEKAARIFRTSECAIITDY
jgi:hypothetical protein